MENLLPSKFWSDNIICSRGRSNPCHSETDTLLQGEELKNWDYLISSNKVFTLKFFGFGSTISPYLGIFYSPHGSGKRKILRLEIYNHRLGMIDYARDGSGNLQKEDKAVWVANRNNPSKDVYGKLTIDIHGKLSILSGGGTVVDLFSPTPVVTRKASATLLDTGNLVLQELHLDGSVKRVLWQSFDYPTDTLLPGMKLGINLKTGHRWSLTSWRNEALPADGSFTLKADPNGTGQMVILRRGNIHWRSGSWLINAGFENTDLQNSGPDVRLYYISNETEQSFTYLTRTYDSTPALMMGLNGQLMGSTLQLDVQCRSIKDNGSEKEKKWVRIWSIIAIASLVSFLSCYFLYKKLNINGKAVKYVMLVVFLEVKKILKLLLHRLRHFYNYIRADNKVNAELHYFTFQSISSATNNFSSANKLGEGGFGAVYKGKLVDGQEVAVKRLSRSSEQGVKEFKNETELIAKLQHTNLVRLIGCCIEKKEKILVYEYMPNKSLDSFLFDPRKKGLLDWNTRFVIIDGIAQGLLYLHRFSRLRVIHRDLKASNILLDDYLKPKISDFGMAKLFGIDESEANTSRVVGTRGYMPPEYMLEGSVSTKTDVFGFGVLLLEIVSSKMNHGSTQHDPEHPLNLLGHAWELWNEAGRGLELMDPVLEDSCTPKEVMTCIHVGLLCVQDHAIDRPTMSEVISMLTNENMHLPEPKRPAFFIERHDPDLAKDNNLENGSVNGQSISILVAR
ncbi:unnamed protein product [Lactuca virosa]|uniref:Receptor-like serine/threonine-protein kinase n=1 Tax=Lactuca virosa TaxID=75947 RepID=A0AAU9LYU9_9ASTR|nr:unnamed protein product [Lactuca virosa]